MADKTDKLRDKAGNTQNNPQSIEKPASPPKAATPGQQGIQQAKQQGLARPAVRVGPQISNIQQKLKKSLASQEASRLENTDKAQRMPNRICLLPDCSGSMSTHVEKVDYHDPDWMNKRDQSKTRIEIERSAVDGFISACNFQNTSVAINGVGTDLKIPLSIDRAEIIMAAASIEAIGGTPIGETLAEALETVSMTRAVLISDGEPTGIDPLAVARSYREAGVAIDTIFIGDSGKKTMELIAELSGGVFIEFTDVTAFAGALKYLAPAFRAMLTSGELDSAEKARLLGAAEVKDYGKR